MPQEKHDGPRQDVRTAIRNARKITGMLQGTMGLEGQGLDKVTLKAMTKRTVRDLLRTESDSRTAG